jgi:hypothetical protein
VPMRWNGATFDRQRGNTEGTLLASAARTAYTAAAAQTNYNARGVILHLNVTAAGAGTLTVQLIGTDALGISYEIATTAAVTATSTLIAYPGVLDADTATYGRSVTLPRTWTAAVAPSGGTSWTYSLTASVIV